MQPNELIQALRQADQEQKQEIKQLLSSQTRKTTRRGLMTAGAGILSWLAIGQAAGQSDLPRSSCEWFGNVDASGYNLQNLNALEGTGLTGGDRLTNIAGTNLTIDADGNLNASGGSSAGALTDSGTDTDGGDDYVLPNAADNIDLQGDGAIQNADTITGNSATVQSLSADELSIGSDGPATSFSDIGGGGTADRTISSTSDLESLPSDIQAGETVRIEQPSTPYQPASWSSGGKYAEINASHIAIVFDSPFAANGDPCIQIADGGDIGGFLFGSGSTRQSHIVVDGMGFDGNHPNQDQTVKRLHAVTFENAERAVCQNGFYTRTSPYREHGSGGSAITARKDASNIIIRGNDGDDTGDRFIQVAGDRITVAQNQSTNGYDRMVSMNVTQPDGLSYYARNVAVVGNVGDGHDTGSIIGCAGGFQRSDRGYFTITGNVGSGPHRSLVTLRDGVSHAIVTNNVGVDGGVGGNPGIDIQGNNTIVANNYLDNYADLGTTVGMYLDGINIACQGNYVLDPDDTGIVSLGAGGSITNNIVIDAGTHGIRSQMGYATIGQNYVERSQRYNIYLQSVSNKVTVIGNRTRQAGQNGNGSDQQELYVDDNNNVIVGNVFQRSNNCVFEGSNAGKNLYVANRGGSALTNMFKNMSASSFGYANYPALFTGEGTVTLTSGGSPAARIDGISGTEGYRPTVKVTADPSASQPASDYSWDEYAEWDDSAGQWDLVVEWRTDPGSDVSALYEAKAEPTSRAIKNA